MTSEIYNEEGKLNHTQASNALENGDYNRYPELNPKRQNKRAKHKIDQAYDALENGNHSKHGDMPIEGKNKEILHESGLRRIDNRPGSRNYIDDYTNMASEVESIHDTKAYPDEKAPSL